MRHKKNLIKLNKKTGPRKALLRALATSLVLKGKMKTTHLRAKAVKSVVEKFITKSQENSLAVRRQLLKYFYDEKAVAKLLNELGPKYKERKGGYTRIIKLANRKGDDATMAIIEFV